MPDAQELPGSGQHQPGPPGGLAAHRGRDGAGTALARMQEEEAPQLCWSQTLLTTCRFQNMYTLLNYVDKFYNTS